MGKIGIYINRYALVNISNGVTYCFVATFALQDIFCCLMLILVYSIVNLSIFVRILINCEISAF